MIPYFRYGGKNTRKSDVIEYYTKKKAKKGKR